MSNANQNSGQRMGQKGPGKTKDQPGAPGDHAPSGNVSSDKQPGKAKEQVSSYEPKRNEETK